MIAYKVWLPISASLAFFLFAFYASVPVVIHTKLLLFSSPPLYQESSIKAPNKNIWADLNSAEAEQVAKFLFSSQALNLTKVSRASSYDSTIRLIELLQPNKTDVLEYLGGSRLPARWARVVVNQAATEDAQIVNYMVGPLPPSESTKILPLDFCYNSDRGHVRDPMPNSELLLSWATDFGLNISDILGELLDGKVDLTDPDTLSMQGNFARYDNGTLLLWAQIYRQGVQNGAWSLMPQGLYIKLDVSARLPKNWKALECFYNGQLYESISYLRDAMKAPDFHKVTVNLDGHWTDTEDFSEGLPGRQKPPPLMIQPEGPRYQLDVGEKFVSWMGFEFFISTASDTGVSLHDIRFGSDSVIYELGLQEAMAHYAGDDPQQGILEFLDSTYMMGKQMYELVPGYDCPAYATFLSTEYSFGDSTQINKNSICIFEYTSDHLLQRHTSDHHVSVSRNTYLVVRSVSTLGNYDYTIDYIFYLDGTIEVKVRASGFIYAAFWAAGRSNAGEFGYRVHDALATSMHDHVINFKADLDIVGTSNTLLRVAIEPLTQDFPWDDTPAHGTGRNTMHLVERAFETETGFDWPSNAGEMYIAVNEAATNVWGEKRGYRIAAGTGMGNPSHLTILNSTTLGVSGEWANRDLWVVRQKDTEPRSSTALNYLEPRDPLVDFSRFVDGESVKNEDLVIYFNLGSHHIPHSGDIPNTLMHTSASSVMFTPFNFNERDPSRRSAQGVRLEKTAKGAAAKYFGGKNEKGANIALGDLEPDLEKGYHTSPEAVRNWTRITGLLGF